MAILMKLLKGLRKEKKRWQKWHILPSRLCGDWAECAQGWDAFFEKKHYYSLFLQILSWKNKDVWLCLFIQLCCYMLEEPVSYTLRSLPLLTSPFGLHSLWISVCVADMLTVSFHQAGESFLLCTGARPKPKIAQYKVKEDFTIMAAMMHGVLYLTS